MRMESSRNIRKSVERGLKREKQYAARNATARATTTAEAEMRKLLRSDGKKSKRFISATKLSSVGVNAHFTGTASRSSLVLKAARMIQRMGRKKTIDTAHSTTW